MEVIPSIGRLMVVTIEPVLQIEAPRNHSLETQERLRQLLDSGAPARPDPKRPDFFEIEDQTQAFYIHVVSQWQNHVARCLESRSGHIAKAGPHP